MTWLRKNSNLHVGPRIDERIGPLAASAADVMLSKSAINDDPACPAKTCVTFIGFEGSDEPYGIAGDDVYRFYLADLQCGGKSRVLLVSVEARDHADLDAFLPAATRLLASARMPLS